MREIRRWLVVACGVILVAVAPGCASGQTTAPRAGGTPQVDAVITAIDRGSLEPLVDQLTGVTPAIIGGSPYRILTRASSSGRPGDVAEQYVYEHLRSYGLTSVRYEPFGRDGVSYRNVVGEVRGRVHPDQIVLVGAHLDSKSGELDDTLAPGADDNAAADAALLVMASTFAKLRFERTIRFVFFAAEEPGHFGSDFDAKAARAAGEDIVMMVGADMIGHNAAGGQVEVHTEPTGVWRRREFALAGLFVRTAQDYGIPAIVPVILQDGNNWSDHEAFWRAGYPAVFVVQDLAQFDPLNHSPGDAAAYLNWPYYVGVAKMLAGATAQEARLLL